jgi:hypothetical protein
VVSRGGHPVPKVSVKTQRDTFHMKIDEGGSTSHADIEPVMTDERGHFTLSKVPKKGVYLRLDGTNILPVEFGRGVGLETESRGQPVDKLRIEVSVRCHLQVNIEDEPELADEVEVLDQTGRPVSIDIFVGNGRRTTRRAEVAEGRSAVLAVPETAATVVFYKGNKEVDRKAIRLTPGKVTTVTL